VLVLLTNDTGMDQLKIYEAHPARNQSRNSVRRHLSHGSDCNAPLRAGAHVVAQRPSFWIEFGTRLGKALLPLAWRYFSKRMPPEEEAAWRQAERRGQGDEWVRGRTQKTRS